MWCVFFLQLKCSVSRGFTRLQRGCRHDGLCGETAQWLCTDKVGGRATGAACTAQRASCCCVQVLGCHRATEKNLSSCLHLHSGRHRSHPGTFCTYCSPCNQIVFWKVVTFSGSKLYFRRTASQGFKLKTKQLYIVKESKGWILVIKFYGQIAAQWLFL